MDPNFSTGDLIDARRVPMSIPTYMPNLPIDLPMFFEKKPYQGAAGRVYPIPYIDTLSEQRQSEIYDAIELENKYLKVIMLPQVGGKVFRAFDKIGRYDFIYYNSVIKPAMIGLAGPWVSGGIEFNWPQHHRPTTFMPVDACINTCENGEQTVWMGEVEPMNRMKGMVGITLCPGRSYLKAKVRLYNRTPFRQPFMWWANLAVPVNENYRVNFPPDVEYVNDHDRRAVIGWPVAKGIYEIARPYDYGEGTNLSDFNAIKVSSSYFVSEGQSEKDFVSGYDHGKQMGIVTYADHSIAPGKKMFHWGDSDFGRTWCSNLTDEDGPYVELMTGVYSDNQPDFTWIMPYETKTFEQYWYPIRDIGDVKNATLDAAVNMEQKGCELFIGIQPTGTFKNCHLRLFHNGNQVLDEMTDVDPSDSYLRYIPMEADWNIQNLRMEFVDEEDNLLIDYQPPMRGVKAPMKPREPAKRPCEIVNNEELILNGLHLEQYKHMTLDPRDYYHEGIRRDPGDIRSNTAMGRLALTNGCFEKAIEYFDQAIERLQCRNYHPDDVEAYYLKGLALRYLGWHDDARRMFEKAIWSYPYRAGGYYELAQLYAKRGQINEALNYVEMSLATGRDNLKALNLKAALLRTVGRTEDAYTLATETRKLDPLDFWAYIESVFAASQMGKSEAVAALSEEISLTFCDKPEDRLDVACEYLHSGLYADAAAVLQEAEDTYPLVKYYLAYISSQTGGEEVGIYLSEAESQTDICFPSRLEDIKVLKFAIEAHEQSSRASYYLGCIYYDRFRYDEAITCWERTIALDSGFANAYRNLGIAFFDKRSDSRSARVCMERALALKPDDARLLYELQQLLKNSDVSVDERLALYEKKHTLMLKRDDCYLDCVMLHCLNGSYKKAIDMAMQRTFHIYEGGEGKITGLHAWMHVLYGYDLQQDEPELAEYIYRKGLIIPQSYGEAKSTFAQEAHVYFFLARLLERMGRPQEAAVAYEEASQYKAIVSELSMFRALALQQMGRFTHAQRVLQEMLDVAQDRLSNSDRYPYFGVGSPMPLPFEYNIEKTNQVDGYVLRAFALLGLGRLREAKQAIAQVCALNSNEFRVYTFKWTVDALAQ